MRLQLVSFGWHKIRLKYEPPECKKERYNHPEQWPLYIQTCLVMEPGMEPIGVPILVKDVVFSTIKHFPITTFLSVIT